MADPLPAFRYHPDPVATGSVEESAGECTACGRARGHRYVGPVYTAGDEPEELCPWCIADGTAAENYAASFTDVGWGVPDDVPSPVLAEVASRTPGFTSWQQDHWLYHCADACAFLGPVGRAELSERPDALEMLLHENDDDGWSPEESQAHVDSFEVDGDPAAYLFRCLHCGTHLAYSDGS